MPRKAINSRLTRGKAPSSRGQGHRPLTAKTRVRIPVGSLRQPAFRQAVSMPEREPRTLLPPSRIPTTPNQIVNAGKLNTSMNEHALGSGGGQLSGQYSLEVHLRASTHRSCCDEPLRGLRGVLLSVRGGGGRRTCPRLQRWRIPSYLP